VARLWRRLPRRQVKAWLALENPGAAHAAARAAASTGLGASGRKLVEDALGEEVKRSAGAEKLIRTAFSSLSDMPGISKGREMLR